MVLGSALACAMGCASPRQGTGPQGTTTIHVVGLEGAAITGHYVQHGYRVPINEGLPFRISGGGFSEVEIRKTHPEAVVSLAAQHNERTRHWEAVSQARDGVAGLRVRIHDVYDGVIVDKLSF